MLCNCLLCGQPTDVIVNIEFHKTPVCDACCLAVTKQAVATLEVVWTKENGTTKIRSRYIGVMR